MSKKVFKKVTIAIKGSISVLNNLSKKILQSNLAFFSHGKLLLIKKNAKFQSTKNLKAHYKKVTTKNLFPGAIKHNKWPWPASVLYNGKGKLASLEGRGG